MTSNGKPDSGERNTAVLERENVRLTAALRSVRQRLETALDEDGGEAALREALEAANRAAIDGDPAASAGARGADGGSEEEEKGRMNPSPSEVLGDTHRRGAGQGREMGGSSPGLLFAITFAGAMAIGVALFAATDNWWILPAALAVHFLGFSLVMGVTARMLQQTTKPDPVTEAKHDEEGVVSERARREPQDDDPKPAEDPVRKDDPYSPAPPGPTPEDPPGMEREPYSPSRTERRGPDG